MLFFACAGPEADLNTSTANDLGRPTVKPKVVLADILNDLQSFIADQYYHPAGSGIKVYIKQTRSNFADEPLFAHYVDVYMSRSFKNKEQFSLTSHNDQSLDCIVENHVIKTAYNDIEILSNIKDSASKMIIYSAKNDLDLDSSSFQKYLTYKAKYKKKIKAGGSHLLVKGKNKGSAFREYGKYYRHQSQYDTYSYSYYKRSESDLISSFYPAYQECIINGKKFKLDANKIFYNQKIPSGRVEFIASFKPGFWDAIESDQKLSEKYSKTFYVEVSEGDQTLVEITFVYDGKNRDIQVNAFKKKQFKIKRDGAIRPYYDTIDVLSK
jgi:hypothetical protein